MTPKPLFCVNKFYLAFSLSSDVRLFQPPLHPPPPPATPPLFRLCCALFFLSSLVFGVALCDVRVAHVCEHARFLGK